MHSSASSLNYWVVRVLFQLIWILNTTILLTNIDTIHILVSIQIYLDIPHRVRVREAQYKCGSHIRSWPRDVDPDDPMLGLSL